MGFRPVLPLIYQAQTPLIPDTYPFPAETSMLSISYIVP